MSLPTKILTRLCIVFVAVMYGCTGQAAYPECSASHLMSELVKSSTDWMPDRRLVDKKSSVTTPQETSDVIPVTGLSVRVGTLWVSTHRSDFSPVELREVGNQVHLEGLRFLRSVPGGAADQPALAVKKYTQAAIRFSISPFESGCTTERLLLTIDGSSAKYRFEPERWLLVQSPRRKR